MDLRRLPARVKGILLAPRAEWAGIATEPATVGSLYRGYVLWLAAIPPLVAFLKSTFVGTSAWLVGTFRVGIGAGLISMLVNYALSLLMVYVLSLVIATLAPTFGGQKNRTQALKTVAYAYTAAWIAAIAQILPGVAWILVIAGALYSIYLMYLGLPQTMKCPRGKAAGYVAVSIVVTIVLGLIVGAISGSVLGIAALMQRAPQTAHVNVPAGAGTRVHEAEQPDTVVQTPDARSQSPSATEQSGAAAPEEAQNDAPVQALAPEQLEPFLPEALGSVPRTDLTVEQSDVGGVEITQVRATYDDDTGALLNVEITDTGAANPLSVSGGWAGKEGERTTETGYEKTYRNADRLIHEEWDASIARGEYTVVLANRFTVKVEGDARHIDELKRAVENLDLQGLEALKNGAAVAN